MHSVNMARLIHQNDARRVTTKISIVKGFDNDPLTKHECICNMP
ncbi:hypothetical protein PMI41_02138 [Phyllobacterium sp. YR531]|nr:hypothetical protein PMI41_02138 [Phyllobacterium sp. YR531]